MAESDDYGIYRRPSAGSLLAIACLAAALFCGSWAMNLRRQVETDAENKRRTEENNYAVLQAKDREVAELSGKIRDLQSEIYETKIRLGIAESRLKSPEAAAISNNKISPNSSTTNISNMSNTANTDSRESAAESAVRPRENSAPTSVVNSIAAPISAMNTANTAKNIADNSSTASATTSSKDEALQIAEQLTDAELLAGQILSYNPDYQRVYLSLGSANGGVEAGNRFSIWRGGEYVTDVEVVKVYSVTSTCKVLNGTPDGLQVGDIARRARPTTGTL